MPATWPAFMQEKLNQNGFNLVLGETSIRSGMDAGPDKVRSISTARVDMFSCSMNLDIVDYDSWDTFYKVSLNNGVNTFYYNHPFTQVQSIFRLKGTPKFTPIGGATLLIDMTWELLP
jgi:hypothetical protein